MSDEVMKQNSGPSTLLGAAAEKPLDSWKEIAAYLGRDVSTVRRWERDEHLPVHRHQHHSRASVYAYASELDGWRAQRRPAEERAVDGFLWRWPARAISMAVMLVAALLTAGGGLINPPSSAAQGQGMTNRLVWSGPNVDVLGAPSPDGKYIAITDWATGNLAIRETTTGTIRRLTENGFWRGWAEFPVPSPDGKQIAYAWFNERVQRDLRVYSFETATTRVVYAHNEVEYAQPFDWTPDGTRILAGLARTDRTNQIALISVADGAARILKTMDWRAPRKLALSPDGRYVAYDFPRKVDSRERDIFLLAADGSREELLIEHPDDDLVLAWTPDGSHLLFGSDRTGRMGIWALPVAEGKAAGPAVVVRADVTMLMPMGVTREGAFYYSVRSGMSDVYLASLDAKTGAVLSPPAPLTPHFVGWNRSPDWSADGKFVAYVSQREIPPRSVGGMGGTIVVRSIAGGEEREITPRLTTMGRLVRWSPDGRFFLVHGSDVKGRVGFFKLNAETGEAILAVREDAPGYLQFQAWSPDSKSIYYLRTTPEASNRLRVHILETGEDREVFGRTINNLAVSPDGRQVVVRFSDEQASVLAIVPASGGQAKELIRVRKPEALPPWSGLAWTPDGKQILFSKVAQMRGDSEVAGVYELWRVPAQGGEPQRIGIAMDGLRDLRVHPDGQRIVFAAGQNKHEVWVMENFLPVQKAAK